MYISLIAYLFRCILEITDFFNEKSINYHIDPFERQKLRELVSSSLWKNIRYTLQFVTTDFAITSLTEQLQLCITSDLWANKIDLCFKPVRYIFKSFLL